MVKINWGYKIAIVIVLFIIGMLSMVYVAFMQTNEMVENNYYSKELKYQNRIDAANNLNQASSDTLISQNSTGIVIRIPEELRNGFKNGMLELFRNDDEKKDLNVPFTPDSNGLFVVERSKLSSGLYKVRVFWNSLKKPYYREQDIMIQ